MWVHKLPWYYQPQWVPSIAWTALVMWHICCRLDGTLKGTVTLDQSGHGSSGNEGIPHIPQSFRTGALASDEV